MAAEASRSGASADSYLGSLISLTSKSEMRYEGVLYNINTDESSIGLSNVRSFGTEGRKKDGPQVPPMDKVFEYILFRGSDIKDLQVKSSPPLQPTPSINNDPAIIQSHYSRPAPTSTTSLPASATGSLSDTSSQNAPTGLPGSNFQSGIPLYQPGGNIGSWGPPPLPNANGSGLGMPMYWQGFYGTSNGLPPHLQQQSLLRPPHGSGLSMPPMQQQMYPGFNIPLPAGTSSFPTINFPSNLPEIPLPLLPPSSTAANLPATSLAPATFPLTLPSTMPPLANASQASETSASLMANKSPNAALPTPALSGSLPVLSPSVISGPDTTFAAPSMPNKANTTFVTTTPYQPVSQSLPSVSILSSPTVPSVSEAPTPSLVTPGQLLQSAPAPVTSLSSQSVHKDVEAVQVSSSSTKAITTEAQPPILPLPTPSRSFQKPNGATFYPRHGYRGRGRGHGSSRPMAKFTEDFDFMAMNEKFNKDEVWGHLGKSKKSNSEEKDEDGKLSDEDEYQEEDDTELSKVEVKAVYNKDDFFDSLSCNALDRDSNTGRPRFSEQMKIDTETFGEFSRYRGGRGGRGPGRGGRFRSSYYGRGYGYGGRGRGRGTPGRAP